MLTRRRGAVRWGWVATVAGVLLVVALATSQVCLSTGFSTGLWLKECPDGELRQIIQASAPGFARGAESEVWVSATALYTTGHADARREAPLTAISPTLTLVGPQGETALSPKEAFQKRGTGVWAKFPTPQVPDGDYQLRVKVKSALGESVLDVPLALYAPARVHVLTDRPLYEPGNTVKFRAVALKANDLSPLDGRPGRWVVKDPQGEVLLEEKAPAGPWGVVAGSFPLDAQAESGTWTVLWQSGDVAQARTFQVKPFTLPRFTVEAAAERPFYRKHERPRVAGTVRYASGAPVAHAKIDLQWAFDGAWVAPTEWTEGPALPREATTSASGAFSVELPAVPEDLQGQSTLTAHLGAVDASGDRVEGATSVLLSEDAIAVTAVSELSGGLVQGFNNRLYLRGTTADGRVLEGVTLNVKRLWEPTDKGTDAPVDEDGVASLQVDPGPPVNIVIPPLPFRPPPREKGVERSSLTDTLAEEGEPSLADRMAFDRLEGPLESCARYCTPGGQSVPVGVRVTPSGAVQGRSSPGGRMGQCLDGVLQGLAFGAGKERLFRAEFAFNDHELAKLTPSLEVVPEAPPGLEQAFNDAVFDVRDCLPNTVPSGPLPMFASWEARRGEREVRVSWAPFASAVTLPAAAQACIQSRLGKLTLEPTPDELAQQGTGVPGERTVGVAHFEIEAPEKYESVRPQATVMTGWEFLVTAKAGHELLGSTKLRVQPGAVPDRRLRVSSQQVQPGETVKVELLRGPDFTGKLPEKLYLSHGREVVETKVEEDSRSATFTVPQAWEGWAAIDWSGAQVFLFIQPRAQLAVTLKAEKPRYAPGQVAQLELETTVAGQGHAAAVGLFGVDQSLAQLAALPGADELSPLRPQVTSAAAFGSLDAQALALGRVRGKNAAAATLLKVSALPPPVELERAISFQAQTVFDPNEPLVDRFYVALGELHVQVRDWEKGAPPAEKMSPRTMARLWGKALDTLESKKESARDAWGRRLRLHRLPADLLALTDPRQVVVDGTRLPEDTENWAAWVAKEKP